MKLHQLKRSTWLKDKAKQRGRWNGTGTGNYSGRWLKGQKARSGHSMKAFFEWGQTSIIQRLPKAKGFKRPFKLVKEVVVVNLWTLDQDKRVSDTMEVTKAKLKELGYIKHETAIVKILGDGNYGKHLTFTGIELFSKSAQEKMAAPTSSVKGGKVKVKSIKDQKVERDTKSVKKVKEVKAVVKPLLETPEIKKVVKEVKDVEVKKTVVKKKVVKKESV